MKISRLYSTAATDLLESWILPSMGSTCCREKEAERSWSWGMVAHGWSLLGIPTVCTAVLVPYVSSILKAAMRGDTHEK